MSTNETCQLNNVNECPIPTTQTHNSWFRKFLSDGSHAGHLEAMRDCKLHSSTRDQDDQINAPLRRDEQFSEGAHKTYSLCSVSSEDGNKGDVSNPSMGINENGLPIINVSTTQHQYETSSRISILPQDNEDHEIAHIKKKIYQQELLKQMQIDRMRKYKEKDLDNQLQKKMDHLQCHPGVPLRDVYGNIIMIRKSENLIKLEEKQSKAPQEFPRSHQVPFKEIFSNISTSDAKEALVRKFKDCHSSLRHDSCSNLPQIKYTGGSFARGGHGIFGQPLSEYEKQSRLKYQEDLLEQIKCKQEKLKAEKEKEKLEEVKFMKQIEDQERKFQQEQEEINRKLQEEERLKKLEREKYLVLKYQRELLEQIQLKKQMKEKEMKEQLEEEVMMLRRQEERRMKYEKEQEEMKEHIKFVEPIKLQARKPVIDILKYQEELLDQIDFKRRLEEIERKKSFLEDEEMMRQSQEKDEKLQQELQLRTLRGFKKLDLSQDENEKLNEFRLQEELLEQIRLKQQKLIEERLRELELDEELLKLQEEKKMKPQLDMQARRRRSQLVKESPDLEYQMELINQMSMRRQLEMEEKQRDLLDEEEMVKRNERTFGLFSQSSQPGILGGRLKDQINEINKLKIEKDKINNLKYKAELLEQMRLKEEVDFLRKEQEKLADLELLRMQEEKEMRKGREVNEGRLLKPSVESDNEKEEYDKIRRLQYLDELLNQIEAKRQEMRENKEHETMEDELLFEERRKMDRRRSIEEREMRKRRKNRLKLPLIDPVERNPPITDEKNLVMSDGAERSPVPSTRRHRTCSNVKRKTEKSCLTRMTAKLQEEQDGQFHDLGVQSDQKTSKESDACLSHTNSSSEFNSCKVCFTPSTLSTKSSGFLPKMSSKPATPTTLRRSNSLHDDKVTCQLKKEEIAPENGEELWQIVSNERAQRLSKMDEEPVGQPQ